MRASPPAATALLALAFLLTAGGAARATPIYNAATGHWYDVVSGDWNQAEAAARLLGDVGDGHLVTVNDQAEQNWLIATFGPFSDTPVTFDPNRYWIGYSEPTTDGVWVWSSGETPGFTAWEPGEPNGNGTLQYAYIGRYADGKWNDGPLDNANKGIAEYSVNPVPEPGALAAAALAAGGGLLARRRRRRAT